MKKVLLLLLLFTCISQLYATHNRAGEITYRWISGTTYEAIITTYTRDRVTADRCELSINWGDGTSNLIPRVNGFQAECSLDFPTAGMGEVIDDDVRMNIYKGRHTYTTSGVYILSFEDPNRNSGVSNINNSVNVPFYVQSELVISESLGGNNSPILLNPPVDDGCHNQIFKHNPGAYDIDGDLITYELVDCRKSQNLNIPSTYDPNIVQDSLTIDSILGDMIWDLPKNIGQFNFAIQINEWRLTGNGEYIRIGYVTRDLQVDIESCNNKPPKITPVGPFCVEAGQNLSFNITATDPDGDNIEMNAFGAPFRIANRADSFYVAESPSPITGTFNWNTACNHVRLLPYYVSFEAHDFPAGQFDEPLVDVFTAEIRVIAPSPKNPLATPSLNSINLQWDQSICAEATSYKIYRRESSYGFIPSVCETGVPEYTGYEKIATNQGLENITYTDSFDLKRGVEYCYMVVACFPDSSESYASVEFCAGLPLTHPLMTNVDVLTTNNTQGKIDIKWISPPILDSSLFPPPYGYTLHRATSIDSGNFTPIASFNSITDTSFTDSLLNTQDSAYRYKVDFLTGPNQEKLGTADEASSVFLEIEPIDEANTLHFTHNTPWENYTYYVYKETTAGSGVFDLIDSTTKDSYTDTALVNGTNYCYYTEAHGAYTLADSSLPKPLINKSQIACGIPLDTNAPCAPLVNFSFDCGSDLLTLNWSQPNIGLCSKNDVKYYHIYYKPNTESAYPATPLYILSSQQNSIDIQQTSDGKTIIGCYAITAIDDADEDNGGQANESLYSNSTCIEPCPLISFPNVFTPNGDGHNDFFTLIDYKDIQELRIQIFNRWGVQVYETHSASDFINKGWDGKDQNSGELCADGVYYYVCYFTPYSLEPPSNEQIVSGFVHLFQNK